MVLLLTPNAVDFQAGGGEQSVIICIKVRVSKRMHRGDNPKIYHEHVYIHRKCPHDPNIFRNYVDTGITCVTIFVRDS